jgi:hypothetical protein
LATAIIRIALRKILSRFRFSVVPGSEIDIRVESTMLVPTNGLPMRIHAPDGQYASSPIGGNIHELVEFDEAPAFVGAEVEAGPDCVEVSLDPRRPR